MPRSHKILFVIYIAIWIITAINPKYPSDWLLENLLPITLFPLVVWLDIKIGFSIPALLLLLIFASLHAVGAHYTYAEVPFFEPIQHLFSLTRNDYDRVVHFLFGLLLFRPIFELISPYAATIKASLWFTFSIIVSISAIYELLEWAAAMLFHPELGIAFLGTQGDVWDAQKDMLAADIGALINLFLFYPLYKNLKKEPKDG
jgi:putative membrane protein